MKVLVRADASVGVGMGHAMRSLALCQALMSQGIECHWLAAAMPHSLANRLQAEGIALSVSSFSAGGADDVIDTTAMAKKLAADWLLVDGYAFSRQYQEAVHAYRTVVIDDLGRTEGYVADLLVNPNLYGAEELYSTSQIGAVLAGRKYALLRREFWTPSERRISPRSRRVLVTMGGSDPDNVTGKVVRSLKRSSVEHLEIRTIVGASNPYWETLQVQAGRAGHPVELLRNVSNMREQFEWADICISAAGSTSLELACVGVPSVFLVIVDNQEMVARAIKKNGFGRVLGWHEDVNEEMIRAAVRDLFASSQERDRMTQWGRELVDGQGALRVASVMKESAIQ